MTSLVMGHKKKEGKLIPPFGGKDVEHATVSMERSEEEVGDRTVSIHESSSSELDDLVSRGWGSVIRVGTEDIVRTMYLCTVRL